MPALLCELRPASRGQAQPPLGPHAVGTDESPSGWGGHREGRRLGRLGSAWGTVLHLGLAHAEGLRPRGAAPALRCPCSRHPHPSHSPERTPGLTSPGPPGPAGTGSPSARWRPTGQTGWRTAHRAGKAAVRGGPGLAPVPPMPPPSTRDHLQLLLGLLRDAAFG